MDEYILYSYSRKQALEDGTLVDVSKLAKDAGIKYPTAFTAAVWAACLGETGWAWDVLWVLAVMARKTTGNEIHFEVILPEGLTKLWAFCGPGDTEEPVLTIMMENED